MHSSGDSLCDTSASWLEIAQICEDVLNVDLSLMDPSDLEQQRISVTPSTDLSLKASDYNEDPRKTFDSGESLFDSSDQFDQCITVLDDAVARLDVIEHTMDETIESLQNCYSSLIASGQVVCKLREEANSINIIESHIATFSEQLAYPTSLQSYIEESNPHSDEFKDALKTLSSKLSFVRLNANTYLNPCESARTHLDGLLQLALYRIKDRLSLSIQLLEDPASNFEILRDALLLNQKELLEFLRNHEPISFNEVVQQYIRLSTTKTRSSIEDYCRLFPSENLEEWPSHELLSLAQGLNKKFSDMLTVVWNRPSSATLGHANVAYDSHDCTDTSDVTAQVLCRLKAAAQRWSMAFDRMAAPSFTVSEVAIMGRDFHPVLEETLHHCTRFFLERFDKESAFLATAFVDGVSQPLLDIFQSSHLPILRLLRRNINCTSTKPSSLILSLFNALLVSRCHRTRIVSHSDVDLRIVYLIEAEKMLQTEFQARFDHEIEAVKHFPEFQLCEGSIAVHKACRPWIPESSATVFAILTASMQGCAEIEAHDIAQMIIRRAKAFVRKGTATICSIPLPNFKGHELNDCKIRLNALVSLLSVVDLTASLSNSGPVFTSLRKVVSVHFDQISAQFAHLVAEKHAGALLGIEADVTSESLEETKTRMSDFCKQWDGVLQEISDEYVFIKSYPGGQQYCKKAVSFAIRNLADANDSLAAAIRNQIPDFTHPLIAKSAILQSMCDSIEQS